MAGFDTAQVLAIVVGTILPLLVGLVTKESWSGGVKAVLLAVLSAADGFLSTALDAANAHASFDWKATFLTALTVFLTATGAHFGLWKPTGAAAAVGRTLVRDKYRLAA
jgi:hypothetical protein